MDATIMKKVMDMNLFRQVQNQANMMRPVAEVLDKG